MFDCLVIGAGMAGLAAASELVKRGCNILVLEARNRVGGRIENGSLSDGEIVELGGQWIGPGHDAMYELAKKYKFKLLDLPSQGEFTVRLQGRTLRVPSREEEPAMTPFEVADLGQGVLRFRRLVERWSTDEAWARSNATWLQQELRRWISTNLRTPGGRKYFKEVYEAAYGPMPHDATLEMGLRQAKTGVDLEGLVAVNGGLHQHRVAGGMFGLCQAMANELGDRIRLDSPVVKIERNNNSAKVTLANGEVVEGRRIISTLPPRLVVKLTIEPPLESWRVETAQKIPLGNVIKAFLVYDKPWWRDDGLTGQMGSDEGSVRVTFDTSGEGYSRGTLMGFFEGADADSLAKRSVTLRERAFIESVVKAFGEKAAHPVEYVERDWSAEPYTGGCHGAHFTPGIWTSNGPQLAVPDGIIHFAGAEYASKFNGYMEGAYRSGRDTAAEVARELAESN